MNQAVQALLMKNEAMRALLRPTSTPRAREFVTVYKNDTFVAGYTRFTDGAIGRMRVFLADPDGTHGSEILTNQDITAWKEFALQLGNDLGYEEVYSHDQFPARYTAGMFTSFSMVLLEEWIRTHYP